MMLHGRKNIHGAKHHFLGGITIFEATLRVLFSRILTFWKQSKLRFMRGNLLLKKCKDQSAWEKKVVDINYRTHWASWYSQKATLVHRKVRINVAGVVDCTVHDIHAFRSSNNSFTMCCHYQVFGWEQCGNFCRRDYPFCCSLAQGASASQLPKKPSGMFC